ncbi:hypothetical protein [Asaia krungthepensis]|uniref:hypothetical protein n=1 Tax=Asaia krungthepensis TaxID=220990 RepID=UPI00222F3257|nr:hypothetical protein [Asaia krungthepensis]
MAWWSRLVPGSKGAARREPLLGRTGQNASHLSAAREWLAIQSGRPFSWTAFDPLPEGPTLYLGDPLSDIETLGHVTLPEAAFPLTPWVFESGDESDAYYAHTNSLIWLEAAGTMPHTKQMVLEFSVDAGCIGIFTETGRTALVKLDAVEGPGTTFEWLTARIPPGAHFAVTLSVSTGHASLFIASTGSDGGFGAASLYDKRGILSGVLIDIAGRAGDRCFIDRLLPEQGRARSHPG